MSTMCQAVCSICWENITKNDMLQATNCGHVFHADCIRNWIRHSETCPQCRADCTSPHQIYLTFEEPSDEDNWNDGEIKAGSEVNRNVGDNGKSISELQIELLAVKERSKIDSERYERVVENLELRVANLEIDLQEATAKEKTLNEEFHYKMQELNTEFHYKFQDLKKVKDELQENLVIAKNAEHQLRNKVDEARSVEDQLRSNLRDYSSQIMDLESEKAELQSKLEASERNARWLKQTVDTLQNEADGLRISLIDSRCKKVPGADIKNASSLQKDLNDYEEKKKKMEDRLRKLKREIEECEEKEAKLNSIKKDMKKPKDGCILI